MLMIEFLEKDIGYFEELKHELSKDVELMKKGNLTGYSDSLVALIGLSATTLPYIAKILIAMIENKRRVIVKYDGIEVSGISEKNADKLLNDLMAKKNDNQ